MRKRGIISILLVLACLLSLGVYTAAADSAESRAAVANVTPVVETVLLEDDIKTPADELDLTEGTTKTIRCDSYLTDANGYTDIVKANATLYHSTSSSGAVDDNNVHYTDGSCALNDGSGVHVAANCTFAVEYYADPGTWTCEVRATDQSDLTNTLTDTSTMNTLTALSIPPLIDFGTLVVGTPSDIVNTTLVNNTGNEQIDISLDGYGVTDGDGYAMNCTSGTNPEIPISNLRYNITAQNESYTQMTSLTDTAFTETAFDLVQRTDDTTPAGAQKSLAFKFNVSGGAGGTCNGTVNIAAISG
ncbi:MAG: hypothetical protein R6U32_07655 [Candidatus Woesearchaeota archaeon]